MNENTSTATSNTSDTATIALTPVIPSILTANTYYWNPAGSASGRRSNEKRHNSDVARFIAANRESLDAAGIVIKFDYSESCHNVYKTCTITRNGKRSNITAVRKALGLL